METLDRHLATERLGLTAPISAFVLTRLVGCLVELGEFAEAVGVSQDGVRLAETLNHPPSLVLAYRGIGHLRLRKGEHQQAIPALEQGLQLCRSMDLRLMFPVIASNLGHAYAMSGRVAEALPILEEAVERGDNIGFMMEQSLRLTWLSEAYLRAGRTDDALRLAGRALDLARAHKERGHEAWALHLLGEIGSRGDRRDVETAEGHYRQALALATELEMRPLVAHCHLGLGQLHRKTGDRTKAEEHLTTAATLCTAPGSLDSRET